MAQFLKNILATVIGMIIASTLTVFIALGIIGLVIHTSSDGSGVGPVEEKSVLHLRMRGSLVDRHKPMDFELFGNRSIFSEDRTQGLWELTRAIEGFDGRGKSGFVRGQARDRSGENRQANLGNLSRDSKFRRGLGEPECSSSQDRRVQGHGKMGLRLRRPSR